jgi:hypothetical protein
MITDASVADGHERGGGGDGVSVSVSVSTVVCKRGQRRQSQAEKNETHAAALPIAPEQKRGERIGERSKPEKAACKAKDRSFRVYSWSAGALGRSPRIHAKRSVSS